MFVLALCNSVACLIHRLALCTSFERQCLVASCLFTRRHVDQLAERFEPLEGFVGGTEWMIDASGCASAPLKDLSLITSLCDQVVTDLGLKVIGQPMVHGFPGHGGVTALYLLSESHLACHTYPENEFATFNLYCCRNRDAWPWRDELVGRLNAKVVAVREIQRDMKRGSQAAHDGVVHDGAVR